MSEIALGKNIDLSGVSGSAIPGRGKTYTLEYHGTRDAVLGLVNLITATRPDIAVFYDNDNAPMWRVRLESASPFESAPEDPPAIWELLGNDVDHDLKEHPNSLALSETELKRVNSQVNNIEKGATSSAPIPASAYGKALLYLLTRTQKGFLRSEYVLRRTQVVSSRSTIVAAFDQIDYIWTPALLSNVEPIPFAILASIYEIPVPTFVAQPDENGSGLTFIWGWLKKSPTVTQTNGSRFQITQEWWLDIWNNYSYPVAT